MLNLSTDDLKFLAKIMQEFDFDYTKYEGLDKDYFLDLRSALINMAESLEKTGEFEINIPDQKDESCGCDHKE